MKILDQITDIKEETELFAKIRNAFFVFGLYTVYAYIFYHILEFFVPRFSVLDFQAFYFGPSFRMPPPLEIFFKSCLVAPVVEELFYRWVPTKIMRKLNLDNYLILVITVGISIYFGREHGSSVAVFAQGVFGLLLGWLYLKNNNIWINIFVHFLWNFFIFKGFYYLGT